MYCKNSIEPPEGLLNLRGYKEGALLDRVVFKEVLENTFFVLKHFKLEIRIITMEY